MMEKSTFCFGLQFKSEMTQRKEGCVILGRLVPPTVGWILPLHLALAHTHTGGPLAKKERS